MFLSDRQKYDLICKIYKWAKSKVKYYHSRVYRNDIKCSNCNEWFSVSGVEYKHKLDYREELFVTTCGKCEHVSYWNTTIAPELIACDENGTPLDNNN